MKNRIERINRLIKEKIAEIILRDIFVEKSLITVQSVNTSRDLKYAKIRVSVIPFSGSKKVIKILGKQTFRLQAELNEAIRLKFVPKIKFYLDETEEKVSRVEEILKKLK